MDSRSIEIEAHEAWDSSDLKKAYELFSKCAENGLVSCMLDLGYFYDEGVGVEQNKSKAMFWYKRAYRKGDSAAASNIAILYREQGKAKLTFQWFQRSVALGDGDSEVELAKLYINGIGVRKSLSKAKELLRKAQASTHITEAGREEATDILGGLE
jgi:TPR repeat protein